MMLRMLPPYRTERGRVSLRADPDSDRSDVTLHDGDVLAFGRGVDCAVRFGHAPVQDREVGRRCGWLVVANGRVVVQAADEVLAATGRTSSEGFRPIVVAPRLGPARTLEPGEMWAPADEIFTVQIAGRNPWELDVVNFRDIGTSGTTDGSDRPTVKPRVELTEELWQVLRAYGGPMQRGGRFPATHEEVARLINWNKMTARRRLERIYDEFYLRRIDMPDVSDMRIKVVEGALTHGLLPRIADD